MRGYKKKLKWAIVLIIHKKSRESERVCANKAQTACETFPSATRPVTPSRRKCFPFQGTLPVCLFISCWSYTSEPAWLWAGTMTATAPMRVRVEELICGDTVRGGGGGTWGWAFSVRSGTATTGLLRSCGGAPFALGGRLCLREGVPPML